MSKVNWNELSFEERLDADQKDRFDSEEQYEIARESIDKAYEDYFGKPGIDDMGYEEYEGYVDWILANSDESAFHGTDDEIRKGWLDAEMFGGVDPQEGKIEEEQYNDYN